LSSVYAFDDSTILNIFVLDIPKGFRYKFNGKEKFKSKNKKRINEFLFKLSEKQIMPLRFTNEQNSIWYPDLERRTRKIINKWLHPYDLTFETVGGIFSANIVLQMEDFFDEINDKFESIIKSKEDISPIKTFFEINEKELTKQDNIPEDEDCEIILTYYNYKAEKDKYLISADEHFWGYKEEIKKEFNINVVEEWLCDTLTVG